MNYWINSNDGAHTRLCRGILRHALTYARTRTHTRASVLTIHTICVITTKEIETKKYISFEEIYLFYSYIN